MAARNVHDSWYNHNALGERRIKWGLRTKQHSLKAFTPPSTCLYCVHVTWIGIYGGAEIGRLIVGAGYLVGQ